MRVMSKLPDRMLIGQKYWRRHGLQLDWEHYSASIRWKGNIVNGPIESRAMGEKMAKESVCAVIKVTGVDQALKEMELR